MSDGVRITVDPTDAIQHLDEMKYRIIEQVRLGVGEAMVGLADRVAANAPVVTGRLRSNILKSPNVHESAELITGTVDAEVGKLHVGAWLEFGTRPHEIRAGALTGRAQKRRILASVSGGGVFGTKVNHPGAAARPFINSSFESYKQQIISTVAARVREVSDEHD